MRVKVRELDLCDARAVIFAPTLSRIDPPGAPHPRGWSSLLPREHGSWALVCEPLALALIAAPSWPGGLLALAAGALFLMRRPCQVLTAEADGPRRALAARALIALGVAALAGAGLAVAQGPRVVLAPLVAAMVAAGVFGWFDRQRDARAVPAECAGSAVYAALAAAIVLLAEGRERWIGAAAVGGFALVRAWTSILAVRVYVRRRKGRAASGRAAQAAAALACLPAIAAAGWPGTSVLAIWTLVFALRTAWLTGPWAPDWPARRIGWLEAGLGTAACITAGLSLP